MGATPAFAFTPRRNRCAVALTVTTLLAGCGTQRQALEPNRLPSLHVANAALASGAPDVALRVADLILARQPDNTDALVARGDALYALGQSGKAKEAYRAALVIDPSSVGGQVGLGRTAAGADPRAAEQLFLAALQQQPDNPVALNNLGVVRDLQGRNAEAQEAYRRALDVAPDSPDVQINLGMSLAVAGQRTEAVRVLRQAAGTPGADAWRSQLVAALTLAGEGVATKDLPASAAPAPSVRPDRVAAVSTQGAGHARAPNATPRPSGIGLPAAVPATEAPPDRAALAAHAGPAALQSSHVASQATASVPAPALSPAPIDARSTAVSAPNTAAQTHAAVLAPSFGLQADIMAMTTSSWPVPLALPDGLAGALRNATHTPTSVMRAPLRAAAPPPAEAPDLGTP